jgi:branched-chain amino acid transport system permease protein
VVGGLATRYGPILGSIVVVLAPQFLTRFGELETLVYGLCLLLFLIFMPHGLSGMFSSLVSKQSVRFVRRSPPRLPPRHAVKKGVGR